MKTECAQAAIRPSSAAHLAILAIFVVITASCVSQEDASLEISSDNPSSLKGYELYSWQDGDQWHFSLLVGTNREKSFAEISSPDSTLKGFEELRLAILELPPGQFVTLFPNTVGPSLPETVIRLVEQVCADQGLVLGKAE